MTHSESADPLARVLEQLLDPGAAAFTRLPLPIWIADHKGLVRWMNVEAAALLGARTGSHFARFIAEDRVNDARELFARKILGSIDTTVQTTAINAVAGTIDAVMVSVPIREGDRIIGVVALIRSARMRDVDCGRPKPRLTPRQHQVLELLAHGRSTPEIAAALQVAEETARNHIRSLLTQVGAKTRLEAVVKAFRNGWL
jgi:DNA-binding CsgD family transcriptional regulator